MKALVLYSGGIDSTVCLAWALKKFDEVETIGFNYGQSNIIELNFASKNCRKFGVNFTKIPIDILSQYTNNAIVKDMEIDTKGLGNTVVDGRNTLFLVMSGIFAKFKDIKDIVIGVSDQNENIYPDTTRNFINQISKTLNIGLDFDFKIHTPLMDKKKKDVFILANELNILDMVKNETMTCYEGTNCGICQACKLREKGYEEYVLHRKNFRNFRKSQTKT